MLPASNRLVISKGFKEYSFEEFLNILGILYINLEISLLLVKLLKVGLLNDELVTELSICQLVRKSLLKSISE